ncbi:uncharacterized protein LOC124241981 [Equus quagga]|uniref:uncharacterized protein LOC124241981 n=1 Tax=Equus quagga TaxID=89248 RepID=UPI001EE29CFF|nr:uncharacterized protein LOC124241981 [Equus quagga]
MSGADYVDGLGCNKGMIHALGKTQQDDLRPVYKALSRPVVSRGLERADTGSRPHSQEPWSFQPRAQGGLRLQADTFQPGRESAGRRRRGCRERRLTPRAPAQPAADATGGLGATPPGTPSRTGPASWPPFPTRLSLHGPIARNRRNPLPVRSNAVGPGGESGLQDVGSGFRPGDLAGSAPFSLFLRAEARLRPWGTVWNPASGAEGKTVWPGAARFAPRRGALCERKWGGSEGGGSRGRPAAPRSGSRASGFPQLPPVFLRSLMEPERGRTGALLQKGRKRRRAPGKHVRAAEARRARSEPEERRPGAKAVPYKGEHTMKGFSDFLESQIKTRLEDEDELWSIGQSEVIEEEVLAEEEEVPFMQKELPEQKLPELENGTKPEEPAEQKETAQKEERVAKPKGPPRQEKKPRVKEEL